MTRVTARATNGNMSTSSQELERLIRLGGPEAEAVKALTSRSTLWRWRRGTRVPSATEAGDIERITRGRIPANGWNVGDEVEA